MKAYCPDCGSATEYSLQKPKFCASCGSSFSIASSKPSKKIFKAPAKVVKTQPNVEAFQEEGEEEESFNLPQIDKLDVSFTSSSFAKSIKLGDIVGSNVDGDQEEFTREKDTSYSLETFEQDFMRDAGGSRRPDAES